MPFGTYPTAHMFVVDFKDGAWGKPAIVPYANFSLSPLTNVIHYSLTCFEGMKAYADVEDIEKVTKGETLTTQRVRLFRPDKNIARLQNSMARLCFPGFDSEEFLRCLEEYVKVEANYVPKQYGYSLYLRPTAFAMDASLSPDPAKHVRVFIVATPVGPLYRPPPGADPKGFQVHPVKLLVEEKAKRAWPGGTGGCKLGANYAGPTLVQEEAHAKGYAQVLWLGANEEVQEVGSMNFICVWKTKEGKTELVTAPLDGSVLPGVTRDSILQLVREWGEATVRECNYYVSDMIAAIEEGRMVECFGCGTAAIVTPVKLLAYKGKEYDVPAPEDAEHSIARRCLKTILDIQHGATPKEWSTLLVS
ncbi:branched-chain amino acid aminotransferase [Angomonas deanei]|nr:branched-chain amino acid aminotransferase [Angomonas deanei]|eukprot:EPY31376.1 branched-chain amino acid aminotransferase [Angomonas deanei]